MKNIETLDLLYKKYRNKTLLDSDITKYYKTYDITLNPCEKTNRLNDAAFVSELNDFGEHNKIYTMAQRVKTTLTHYNLLFYRRVYLLLPLWFISFDGQFKNRLKALLDRAFFDPNYIGVNENSYIVLIERSDILLGIEVLHTRAISSEVIPIITNEIKKGYFLADNHQDEIQKRIDFWDYLNFSPVQVSSLDLRCLPQLWEWECYFNYWKKKTGHYPNEKERILIETNWCNKWLHYRLFIQFEAYEKFYHTEDFEEIKYMYTQLGFDRVRYLGGGHFNYESQAELADNLRDYIMEPVYWQCLRLKTDNKLNYRRLINFFINCLNLYVLILMRLLAAKKKEIHMSDEDVLTLVVYLNLITDPTINIFPKDRDPVSYDFFTTLRFIVLPEDTTNPKLQLMDPLVELTEKNKSFIKTLADRYNFTLIENIKNPEFETYKSFFLRHYQRIHLTSEKDNIFM